MAKTKTTKAETKTTKAISFHDALCDPNLFGKRFAGESWNGWKVIAKALFAEPLNEAELALYRLVTGRDEAPTQRATEAWLVVGRRGGKDAFCAALAVYLSTLGVELYGWRKRLSRGERGVVQLLAVDRDQAQVAFRYISSYFDEPIFAKLVTRRTADTIELTNGFAIEVATSRGRSVRGRTVIAAILDEVAFFRDESSTNPDTEVYEAIKPATATIEGALIIGISSPYARRGLLWTKYSQHFGKPGNVLVVQAPTWVMNPLVPKHGEIISEAYDNDAVSAAAEYGAEFRTDVESFLSREAIEACIEPGRRERPPLLEHVYSAFCDPSGGSSDSMTLAISHFEGKSAVLDCVREVRPPFSPEAVVLEFAALLKTYRCTKVVGDRYGGEWVAESFRRAGGYYEASEKTKNDLYRELLPLVNSRGVVLLDDKKLTNQLVSLERRVSRGGRDSVDHPPGAHDDVANCAAGALVLAQESPGWSPRQSREWNKLIEQRKKRLAASIV